MNEERKMHSFIVMGIFAGCCFIVVVLAYFIKEDLRRVNFKKEDQDEANNTTELSTVDGQKSINN